jgi:hypothetical protein
VLDEREQWSKEATSQANKGGLVELQRGSNEPLITRQRERERERLERVNREKGKKRGEERGE